MLPHTSVNREDCRLSKDLMADSKFRKRPKENVSPDGEEDSRRLKGIKGGEGNKRKP